MIKKLKIGFLGSVLALALMAVVGVQNVGAQALTFSSRTNIEIGGKTYLIDSGGEATTVVVGLASATITVPAASTVTFFSLDRFALDNDGSLTTVCTDTTTYITITGAATVVVTPDTSDQPCGGGGGGGGGGSSKPKTSATPVAPATPSLTPGTFLGGGAYNFGTETLKVGSRGAGVMELQKFLNATMNLGLVVDGMLGPKTIAVMMQWQTAHGLVSDGLIGPATKAAMNASVGVTPATPAVPASPSTGPYNFGTTTLKNGSAGPAVMELQKFLNAKLNLGLVVDGKLGPKTIAVIKQWQTDNGLVPDGLIGPATKAKMNASVAQ